MNEQETLVIFRRWRVTGDIIALFPELPSESEGRFCDAYEHVGQHGGADYHGVVRATRPVSVDDAGDLIAELTRIGYRLKPIKRASQRVHESRRVTARAIRISPSSIRDDCP
jgi:hypothetical protein